jgi:hypothetical protein
MDLPIPKFLRQERFFEVERGSELRCYIFWGINLNEI